jgi:hypothetical protein
VSLLEPVRRVHDALETSKETEIVAAPRSERVNTRKTETADYEETTSKGNVRVENTK